MEQFIFEVDIESKEVIEEVPFNKKQFIKLIGTLNENIRIINESSNIMCVINNYDDLLTSLKNLSEYEDYPKCRLNGKLPSEFYTYFLMEKVSYYNEVIKQIFSDEKNKVAILKTALARKRRLYKYLDELVNKQELPIETKDYLYSLMNEDVFENKLMIKSKLYSPYELIKEFYQYSTAGSSTKDIYEKLKLYEKDIELLPGFTFISYIQDVNYLQLYIVEMNCLIYICD